MPYGDIFTGADDIDRLLVTSGAMGPMLTGAGYEILTGADDSDAANLAVISGLEYDPFGLAQTSGDPLVGADLVGLDSVVGATPASLQQRFALLQRQNLALRAAAAKAIQKGNAAQAIANQRRIGERGRLVDREPKKLRKYLFGLLATADTPAGSTGSVTTRPQVPIKITKLVLRGAPFWNINDVKIGKDSQLAGGDPIAGEIFDGTVDANEILADTASNGQDIIFQFQNITGAPRRFHMSIIGYCVE